MSKKKYYYYVLVFTDYGAVFVTSTPQRNYARWDKLEPPKEFGKYQAEDIAMGLNLNGHSACMVVYPYEMTYQPYNYQGGKFKWEKNKKEEVEK